MSLYQFPKVIVFCILEKKIEIVVPEGVEPSTLALLAPHSNQLSYGTICWFCLAIKCKIYECTFIDGE